jgi:hypothetical protein
MPTKTWANAAGGDWATGTNWGPSSGVPKQNEDVSINLSGTGPYTVTYDEAANHSIINSLTIDAANATLSFASGFSLTVSTVTDLTAGSINILNSGDLLTTTTFTSQANTVVDVGNGGLLNVGVGQIQDNGLLESTAGIGQVDGTLSGVGTVEAAGGNLVLVNAITSLGLNYQVSNSAASVLTMDGTVAANNTFTFQGAAGEFLFNNTAAETQNIVGMNVGANTTPTNFVGLAGSWTVSSGSPNTGTSATVTLSNGTVTDTLDLSGITGPTGGTWFANTVAAGGATDLFLSAVCFAAGTHIGIPGSEKVVESLTPGDVVFTLAGGQLSPQPVKWIGRRRIDLTLHPRPETVAPIRILRGAFADDIPHRDLIVSPDHALLVDGKLICARQFVNGTTIRQEFGWSAVDYYHVELDAHAILLAEGLPAESYLDTGNQGFFTNSGAPLVLHPDLTDETDYPRRESASCAPFVWDEVSVRPVWQRLADRAAAIGRPVPQRATTADPDLRLRSRRPRQANGKPVHQDDNLVIFVVPRGSREIRLISRAQSPTETRPWLNDRRRLGIRVKRIVLRGMNELREVPMDHPALTKGWWDIERDGQMMSRWTDGDAVVALPAMDGPIMLEVHLAGKMIYAVGAEAEGPAERHAA